MADNFTLPRANPGSDGRSRGIAVPDAGDVQIQSLRPDPGLAAPKEAFGGGAGLEQAGEKLQTLALRDANVIQRQQKEYDATRTNEALLAFERQSMDAYQQSQTTDDPSRVGYAFDLEKNLIGERDPTTGQLQIGGIAKGILDNLDPNVSDDAREKLRIAMQRSALSITSAAGRLSLKAAQDRSYNTATQLVNAAAAQASYYPDHADSIASELSERLADFSGTMGPEKEDALRKFADKSIGESVILGYARAGRFDDANATLVSGKYDSIFSADDRQSLTRQIHVYQSQAQVDEDRKREAAKRAQQEAAENSGTKLVNDMLADPLHFDPKRIAADPNLKYEQKLAISRAYQAEINRDGSGHDEKTYGAGFWKLYQDIHRPAGDPQRITDPTVLYDHAGPDGDLTLAGVRALTTEIQGKRTPEGEAESLMKKTFLQTAKRQISGDTVLPGGFHIRDPNGEQNYARFLAKVTPAMQQAQNDGRLTEMLNPDSNDSLYGLIGQFRRPDAERMRDMLSANQGLGGTQAPAGVDVSTKDALIKAVREKRISREEGEAIALRNKWIRPSAPVKTPQVPVP